MNKTIITALLLIIALCFAACDDGRIEEKTVPFKQGRVVKMTGLLTGLENWPDEYTVAVAGFDGTDDYAVISKAIPKNASGSTEVVLSGISSKVTNVQLCVLDRLRRHVMTFQEIELPQTSDTIPLQVGTVDVSMLNAIQQSYFNTTCANCHGASNRAAAGLYLTEGRSYGAMVNVDSRKVKGKKLVQPYNASESVLNMVLCQETVEGISMAHYDLVSEKNKQSILPLIDAWISNGAKEN